MKVVENESLMIFKSLNNFEYYYPKLYSLKLKYLLIFKKFRHKVLDI
jgi:hypothetical protein